MSEVFKAVPENATNSGQPITTIPADRAEKSPNQPQIKKHSWLWRIIDAFVRSLPDKPYIP